MNRKNNTNFLVLKFKEDIYPLTAVMTTAYTFLDKVYVKLDSGPKGIISVELVHKDDQGKLDKAALRGEFTNELLNCTVREKIAAENAKIREYIVGQALYSSVQDMNTEGSDTVVDDPLGIAVPWEEKYGKKKKRSKAVKKKQ